MSRAAQSKCTNDVDIQSIHKYEQYDACPHDHTFYLTAKGRQTQLQLLITMTRGKFSPKAELKNTVVKIDTSTSACW